MKSQFCLLLRGRPAAGKTTIVNHLTEHFPNSYRRIDSDYVDKKSKEFKHFRPKQTKNPSDMVKMYCYLFGQAECSVQNGESIIWEQPWSRISEIDLTIRNFAYYFTSLKESVWETQTNELIDLLPFKLYIAEILISNDLSEKRYKERDSTTPSVDEISRLRKTNKMFQKISKYENYLILNGNEQVEYNSKKLQEYLNLKPTKKTTPTPTN